MQDTHDLHVHLGGAVPAPVLWELLKGQGLETEHTTFVAFQEALTARADPKAGLDGFLGRYFKISEQIQSSPEAAETSAYQAFAKIARRSHAASVELRFNPAKRLRGNLYNIDAVISAVVRGIAKGCDHYGMQGGSILCLGRDVSFQTNTEILAAAIRWKPKGVLGIDMAGPESGQLELDDQWLSETAELFRTARAAGLHTTYHVGETDATGPEAIARVLHRVRPERIGHGVQLRKATGKELTNLIGTLRDTDTCLEICPTVNRVTGSATTREIQALCRTLRRAKCPFAICTDNPYLILTSLPKELDIACPQAAEKTWALDCAHAHRFTA